MEIIIFIVFIILGLFLAISVLVYYTIPWLLAAILGGLVINHQRRELTASSQAHRFIKLSPNTPNKPWFIDAERVEAAVDVQLVQIAGWSSTALATLVMFASTMSGDMSRGFNSFVTVIAAIGGIVCGVYGTNSFSEWCRKRIIKQVTSDLNQGVYGLSHIVQLKDVNQKTEMMLKEHFDIAVHGGQETKFFQTLQSTPKEQWATAIAQAIEQAQTYLVKLHEASSEYESLKQTYLKISKLVNVSGLGSLIIEMDDLYSGIYSEQFKDIVLSGEWTEVNQIIGSMQTDLDRVKVLAEQREPASPLQSIISRDDALEILGVGPDDTIDVVKNRYRALVKQLHPDMTSHLTEAEKMKRQERFRRIQDAYDLIQTT